MFLALTSMILGAVTLFLVKVKRLVLNIQTHVVSSCVVTLAEVKVNATFNGCMVNPKIPLHIIGEMS